MQMTLKLLMVTMLISDLLRVLVSMSVFPKIKMDSLDMLSK